MQYKKNSKLTLDQLKEIAKRDMDLDIGISTLSDILKNDTKWTGTDFPTTYSRVPPANHAVLEKSLVEWISRMDSVNGFLNEEIIIAKAKEYGEKLKIEGLKFSHGWLHRFKNRYNLKMRNLHGEAASISDENVQKLRKDISDNLKEIDPECLLNMDETALFFQAFPTKTIGMKERKGIKQSKARITVALTSNATGSIKIKPFLIGHSKKPRCFKDFNYQKYCHYYANSRAWMTTDLFNIFLKHLSDELKPSKKQFVLLMDNAPSHVLTSEYENIKVFALPKNSTAHLQPMDAGIIRNLKSFYRKKLIIDYMACLDRGKQFSVDLRKAILMIHDAWSQVQSKTIENCFRKTGIVKAFESENVNSTDSTEKDGIIDQYAIELDALINEEKDEETEKIDDEIILNLFQDNYEIEDFIKDAENGSQSSIIKPAQILDAIDVLLDMKVAGSQFSNSLSTQAINDLKSLKRDLEAFVAAKTKQTSIYEFSGKKNI